MKTIVQRLRRDGVECAVGLRRIRKKKPTKFDGRIESGELEIKMLAGLVLGLALLVAPAHAASASAG